MKMAYLEKRFVNRTGHASRVARRQMTLLRLAGVTQGASYLDLGCGNGLATLEVAGGLGLNGTGVDVDPEQIRLANEHRRGAKNMAFVLYEGLRLPFASEQFDVVGTFKATHHIPRWEEVISEMIRVLRPGGFLIYSDFVLPTWAARIGQRIGGRRAGFPTRAALRSLADRHGLSERYRASTWLRCELVLQKSAG